MNRHFLLCLLCLLICPSLLLAEAPRMVLSENVFDFGTVNEGSVLSHEFVVTNTGDADLRIERIAAGCRCSVVDFTRDAILPNETAKISIQFDTTGFNGDVEREFKIFTNENVKSLNSFIVKGVVIPEISIEPAYLDFGNVIKNGANPTAHVNIRVREDAKAKIGQVSSFLDALEISNLQGNERQKSFDVTFKSSIKTGEFRNRIIVEISDSKRLSINIPVFAFITNALTLSPKVITLGTINQTDGIITKEAVLNNQSDTPIEIQDIDSDNAAVEANYRKADDNNYLITILVDSAKINNKLKATLTIETDSESQPEMVLGVHGISRKNKKN